MSNELNTLSSSHDWEVLQSANMVRCRSCGQLAPYNGNLPKTICVQRQARTKPTEDKMMRPTQAETK